MMRSPERRRSPAACEPVAHGCHHRLQVGGGALGGHALVLLAVHEHQGVARRLGLHARPERHGAVEDVPGEDPLDVPGDVRRVGHLERRQQRHDRAAVAARAPRPPPAPRPWAVPASGRVAPSATRPAVDRKPASGASMPSFSWTAGTLKPTFQPSASAPSASISRRRSSMAAVAAGTAASLMAASRSSAPRAGRRPRRPPAPRPGSCAGSRAAWGRARRPPSSPAPGPHGRSRWRGPR